MLDFSRFHEKALVKALVEQDLAYLSRGEPLDILGKKLFGLEIYGHVADNCSGLSQRKEVELRRLKWRYLSEILATPNGRGQRRTQILHTADFADDDADRLIRQLGCGSKVVRRIVAEVGQ